MSWEDKVRKVVPYVPGEQPSDDHKVIKLNTNEMPYPPSPKVAEALASFDIDSLRLYPAPDVGPLRDALAARYGVGSDEMFVGVGSDDVLATAFLTFFNSDKPVIFPDITYSFYDVWCDVYRIPYEIKKLDEDFHIVKNDYMTENGGIVIANPNAPTGVSEDKDVDFIEDIVKANPESVVIVDEAYVDFGAESCVPLIKEYDNLLVTQTFSKSRSMAGARLGMGIGNPELIRDLNAIKYSLNPYNVNSLTSAAGVASLKLDEYNKKNCEIIMETRSRTERALRELGFEMTTSQTNFLFARHPAIAGEDLYLELKKKGILIRHFNKERIKDYNRITIGTPEQMETLVATIKQVLEGKA